VVVLTSFAIAAKPNSFVTKDSITPAKKIVTMTFALIALKMEKLKQ